MEDIKTILSDFETMLDKAVRQPWEQEDGPAVLEALTIGAEAIGEGMIQMGNTCVDRISEEGTMNVFCSVIHFLWAARAKAFLILWRDILFEQQKAQVLYRNGQLTEAQLADLRVQSKEVLTVASIELKEYPEKEMQATRRSRGGAFQLIKRWKLMENPWPTYREQIAFLPAQCRCLLDEHISLQKVDSGFSATQSLINQTMGDCKEEMGRMETLAKDTVQFIEENIEAGNGPKPGKIATRLEDLEQGLELPDYLTSFNRELEDSLANLPEKTQVSVQIENGMVEYKEINFRRSGRQWLESEVLPVLYEIWELTGDARQSLQMSLVNIRNRTLLLATEMREGRAPDVERADLCQPLLAFLKKMATYTANFKELHNLVQERLQKEFSIPVVYQLTRDFLPVPLQSTINQLGFSRNMVLDWGQKWLGELTSRLQQFKTSVEQEESLGDSEKIVRFIRNRTFSPENHHYTGIFITKGYIGESFWVGRQQELEHMASLIENWRQGFRGAVMLSGQRFSGKSLFGELVANRYFSKNTIRLAPKSTVRVQGRHMTVGYDLGEALDFIRKHSLNIRPLVWIDDLELWQDPEHPLSQNVRMLRKNVDNYAGRVFYMVSMSNWLKAHLQKFHEIEKIFQAEVNLDRMSADDIREAILIRHGATHKTLVDDKGREVTPQQFRKMTNRISKASDGNIGEALNWWSFSNQKVNDEKVKHVFSASYHLPDFINPDPALVLSVIMLEKRTNEYRLRKLFGPAFADKYGGIVQRLISLGLLTRHPDGWLEVNEVVVNQMGEMLEKKQYLPV